MGVTPVGPTSPVGVGPDPGTIPSGVPGTGNPQPVTPAKKSNALPQVATFTDTRGGVHVWKYDGATNVWTPVYSTNLQVGSITTKAEIASMVISTAPLSAAQIAWEAATGGYVENITSLLGSGIVY